MNCIKILFKNNSNNKVITDRIEYLRFSWNMSEIFTHKIQQEDKEIHFDVKIV